MQLSTNYVIKLYGAELTAPSNKQMNTKGQKLLINK